MRSVFFILLSFLIYGSSVSAQNLIQQALDDFLKKNNVFHFTEKDSNAVKIANKTHAAYFFTNKKGQTTLTVPKGAISIKIPQGDSVVHAKVVSPKFPKDTYGMLTLTRYYKGGKGGRTLHRNGRNLWKYGSKGRYSHRQPREADGIPIFFKRYDSRIPVA